MYELRREVDVEPKARLTHLELGLIGFLVMVGTATVSLLAAAGALAILRALGVVR